MVQSLVLNETLNTALEASYKQYYLSLGAAAALFRWYIRYFEMVANVGNQLEVYLQFLERPGDLVLSGLRLVSELKFSMLQMMYNQELELFEVRKFIANSL